MQKLCQCKTTDFVVVAAVDVAVVAAAAIVFVLCFVPFEHKLNSSSVMFCFNYANALPICTDTY